MGPSSQFKNRFLVAAISSLQEKHKINIIWNYFATSHGKGPVDGIGGSVKRQVWMDVSNTTENPLLLMQLRSVLPQSKYPMWML
jgi:hypothetical protein